MDIIIALKLASSLDTFPGRCNLDQDTIFFDTDRLVESDELLCLKKQRVKIEIIPGTKPCIPWPLLLPCRMKDGHRPQWKHGRGR